MRLRLDRKDERQAEAKARQNAYNKLSTAQKIAKLDALYGKGKGATKP